MIQHIRILPCAFQNLGFEHWNKNWTHYHGNIRENTKIVILFYEVIKICKTYLSISNALVFPSYREGFPNVVMQAGAMGLPSIVTDINGCNEIIYRVRT